MTIKLLFPEDTYLRLYRRVIADWIYITGDSSAVEYLEDLIYTPGTDKNGDFEAVMGIHGYFFIGRKTPELRKFLKLDNDAPAWDSVFALKIHRVEGGVMCETKHFTEMQSREMLLESLTKRMVEWLGGKYP